MHFGICRKCGGTDWVEVKYPHGIRGSGGHRGWSYCRPCWTAWDAPRDEYVQELEAIRCEEGL